MATFVKYDDFNLQLGKGVHQLHAAGHTLKVALTNTAPDVDLHTVLADITEIAAGNGYSAGGADIQNDYTEAAGVGTLTGVDVVFTASVGSIGPFQYAVVYNDTPAGPVDPLVCYWAYPVSITVLVGETFTVNFGASIVTIT